MQAEKTEKYIYLFAIAVLTLAGLILRSMFLNKMGSYWFDEMASMVIARLDFPKIWEYLVIENNPPLSFLFLHFWIKLFGEGEKIVRISSLIFGIAAIPMTYLIGKEIFSRKTGLFAALFMSVSFFQIYYSAEARMYSLFQLLALFSIYFFWKILKENKNIFWVLYAVSSVLMVYTHIFAWAVIVFQNIAVFVCRKNYAKIKNKILAMDFFIFIFFLAWFIPKIRATELLNIANGWYFNANADILSIGRTIIDLIYTNAPNRFMELPLVVLIVLSAISAFLYSIKNNKNNEYSFAFILSKSLIFVSLWIITPIIIVLLFFPSALTKYIIFIGPALYLLIAQGINNFKLRFEYKLPIIIFISLSLFITASDNIANNKKINIWDDVANYITETQKPGDKIILHSFVTLFEFNQYYKGKIPYEGFYIFNDNEEINKIVIKRNWNTVFLEKDYPLIANKLKNITKGYKRIFLVESDAAAFDPENLVISWFMKNNWRLAEKEDLNYSSTIYPNGPKIWLWEKIN